MRLGQLPIDHAEPAAREQHQVGVAQIAVLEHHRQVRPAQRRHQLPRSLQQPRFLRRERKHLLEIAQRSLDQPLEPVRGGVVRRLLQIAQPAGDGGAAAGAVAADGRRVHRAADQRGLDQNRVVAILLEGDHARDRVEPAGAEGLDRAQVGDLALDAGARAGQTRQLRDEQRLGPALRQHQKDHVAGGAEPRRHHDAR